MPCGGRDDWPGEWVAEWDLANCEEICASLRAKVDNAEVVRGIRKPTSRMHQKHAIEFVG